MAFEGLINMPYEAASEYGDILDVNYIRGIVTLKGTSVNDTLFADSSVIVFYEIINRTKPEVIVERVAKKGLSRFKVRRLVKKLGRQLGDTHVVSLSDSRQYYDVVLINKDLLGDGRGSV